MDRRQFLRRALQASAGGAVLGALPVSAAHGQTATPGEGPYGPLASAPDANGLLLPEGFTSRVVAVAGEPVGDTGYSWHAFPDGAATFATDDGGWIYVCNSEVFDFLVPDSGGASAVVFAAGGDVVDAYRVLEGSNSNCAGGPTPWGTWLSCEENFGEQGRVFECDPRGVAPAVAHEAMGRWAHEAAAVDPDGRAVYLTQDHPEGLLYRYTPTSYPDLSSGVLEACVVAPDGAVSWQPVPDPSGTDTPTRQQAPGATVFPGNEGIWYHDGFVFFTSKGDHSVHSIDLRNQRYELLWRGEPDRLGVEGAVLSGVDNLTVDHGSGDLYVAEDGGNMEVVMITAEGTVAPFVRIAAAGHDGSEVTGPCFDPSGQRLYFSSQRGPTPKPVAAILPGYEGGITGGGITYEVTGPFRGGVQAIPTASTSTTVPAPTTTLAAAGESANGASADDDDYTVPAVLGTAGVVGAGAIAAAIAARRRRV